MIARRDLLAALALPAGWRLAPTVDDHIVLTESPGPTRVALPARRAGCVAQFALGGAPAAAVRFGASTPRGEDIDVLAVAGGGVLLLLEPWAGAAPCGAHFSTRLDVLPQGRGLRLRRIAAFPRQPTLWDRQAWTDFIAWRGGGLRDAPVRPPLAGTWQANVSERRAATLRRLEARTSAIDDEALALAGQWPWDQIRS